MVGIEASLRNVFAETGDSVVAAYLFGSQARGEAGPHSDVDVAVLFRDAPSRRLGGTVSRLHAQLERDLERPVDLIALNEAPCDLVHRVLKEGKLVYESSTSRRIEFEVRVRALYLDLLPHLRRYRKEVA